MTLDAKLALSGQSINVATATQSFELLTDGQSAGRQIAVGGGTFFVNVTTGSSDASIDPVNFDLCYSLDNGTNLGVICTVTDETSSAGVATGIYAKNFGPMDLRVDRTGLTLASLKLYVRYRGAAAGTGSIVISAYIGDRSALGVERT
jgi:hypothetical protein